jgi:erythronate-4-phosphate dehydrogenase
MNYFSIDTNIPLLLEILKQNDKNIINTFDSGKITNQELIKHQTEYLIVRSTIKVNEELLHNTNVKFVATATTGTDHVDISYLNKNNILFFVAIGANSNSVAEYVIFSLLFAFKNDYKKLLKKTIGIIGFGNVGSKVAYYLNKMNINHIICDPFLEKNVKYSNILFYSIDSLIKNSDIITFHVPLTTNTDYPTLNFMNKERIAELKNNSLLINTARGKVCDEKELLKHQNRLQFIIDVWENEPNINSQLVQTALIATPHIAGHSYNGKLNATLMICDELNKKYEMNLHYNINFNNKMEKNVNSNNINVNVNNVNVIDISDFETLFNILNVSRKIINTSNEMKNEINSTNFANYFINIRKNYPKYFETLIV